ncbi:hypothetical protein GQR58_004456 [Nymphon striatum]|nr:hypothetical protein GQR58_004456 [Nymphon striatum]
MHQLGILLGCIIFVGNLGVASAEDRHAGYYYPTPQSEETYQAPLPVFTGVSRLSRVGFVTGLDQQQKQKPYPPAYHMFAKGADAQRLIIVATEEGRYNTLYRLRGLLASMTADARTSPIFAKIGHVEQLNFFDLIKIVGFKELTITNGNDVSHRVIIEYCGFWQLLVGNKLNYKAQGQQSKRENCDPTGWANTNGCQFWPVD